MRSATPNPATWRSVPFGGDARPRFAHGPRNLSLLFGSLYESGCGHVERSCKARDPAPCRARSTTLNAPKERRVHPSSVRKGFDREVPVPAQATDRLAEIGVRRHGSDRAAGQLQESHGRPRGEHAAVPGGRYKSGTEKFLDCDAGVLGALDLAGEVIHRPDGLLICEQVQHAPFGLIQPASRGTSILGLHGSFASCATAPGQFALSLGPTCMDQPTLDWFRDGRKGFRQGFRQALLDQLGPEPYLFQEHIPKSHDVRATVIGDEVLAAAIDSQQDTETRTDWRRGHPGSLGHEVTALPDAIAERCVELCRRLGLLFGAIDLAVRPDGGYSFFEINPNGQWAWVEQRTGESSGTNWRSR